MLSEISVKRELLNHEMKVEVFKPQTPYAPCFSALHKSSHIYVTPLLKICFWYELQCKSVFIIVVCTLSRFSAILVEVHT